MYPSFPLTASQILLFLNVFSRLHSAISFQNNVYSICMTSLPSKRVNEALHIMQPYFSEINIIFHRARYRHLTVTIYARFTSVATSYMPLSSLSFSTSFSRYVIVVLIFRIWTFFHDRNTFTIRPSHPLPSSFIDASFFIVIFRVHITSVHMVLIKLLCLFQSRRSSSRSLLRRLPIPFHSTN